MHISIVSPVYGCASCIKALCAELCTAMQAIECSDFEIVLVNDASPDQAWNAIEEASSLHPQVQGINLSRNFGQHAAIHAGLANAQGEWIVVMDCDLQDRPDQIPKLYHKVIEGYDLAVAQRVQRQDSRSKRMGSTWFYRILSYLTETHIDPSIANFGIYNRKAVSAILAMGDYIKFFPTMAVWIGFKRIEVPVEHGLRETGKSSYNISRLMRLGFNVIISFSDKPLRLVVKFGFMIMIIVFLAALMVAYRYFTGSIVVTGYTSLLLSVWFFGGFTLSILGLTGLYVGKAFDQSKNRPVYLISDKTDPRS